jgi:hypothetical protein
MTMVDSMRDGLLQVADQELRSVLERFTVATVDGGNLMRTLTLEPQSPGWPPVPFSFPRWNDSVGSILLRRESMRSTPARLPRSARSRDDVLRNALKRARGKSRRVTHG